MGMRGIGFQGPVFNPGPMLVCWSILSGVRGVVTLKGKMVEGSGGQSYSYKVTPLRN